MGFWAWVLLLACDSTHCSGYEDVSGGVRLKTVRLVSEKVSEMDDAVMLLVRISHVACIRGSFIIY